MQITINPDFLVIDDEPAIARFIKSVAESCGFEVFATTDATAFREAFLGCKPQVLATDLSMPDYDGIQLLRFLADHSCKAQIFVISGFDRRVVESASRLGRELGLNMAGSILKPVRAAELRRILLPLRLAA